MKFSHFSDSSGIPFSFSFFLYTFSFAEEFEILSEFSEVEKIKIFFYIL